MFCILSLSYLSSSDAPILPISNKSFASFFMSYVNDISGFSTIALWLPTPIGIPALEAAMAISSFIFNVAAGPPVMPDMNIGALICFPRRVVEIFTSSVFMLEPLGNTFTFSNIVVLLWYWVSLFSIMRMCSSFLCGVLSCSLGN